VIVVWKVGRKLEGGRWVFVGDAKTQVVGWETTRVNGRVKVVLLSLGVKI
jgi:hypothetical protein